MRLRRATFVVCLVAPPFAACISSPSAGPAPDGGLLAFDSGSFVIDAGADTTITLDASLDAPPDAPDAQPSCLVQAALNALGADAGGTVIANDFSCTTGLDLDASTAPIDLTGTGFARAVQARQLGAPGDGGEGTFTTDGAVAPDAGFASLPAGVHSFASFELDHGVLVAGGDLTLDVAGPFTILRNGNLYVQGNLTLVAAGPIRLEGFLYVAGDTTVQQPTNAGITLGASVQGTTQVAGIYSGYSAAASSFNPAMTAISAGTIEVDTRGALLLPNAYVYSSGFGAGAAAKSGDITLRAYGDITFGGVYNPDAGTGQESYMYVGSPCPAQGDGGACKLGANGNMRVYSEGTITFDYDSFLYAGDLSNGATGGNLSVRGVAGVQFRKSSYAYAGYQGSVDILSQGDVSFDQGSYTYSGEGPSAPTNVSVRARSFTMVNGSYAYAGGQAGGLTIATTGDVTLDTSAYLYAGNGACTPGGALEIDAEGNVAITNGASVYGGSSNAGAGCSAGPGGAAIVRAGGTLTAPIPDSGPGPINAGTGSAPGAVTRAGGASVGVGVLDTMLEPSVAVVSLPAGTASSALLFGGVGPTDPASFFGAHVLVSADGSLTGFTSIPDALGKPLSSGWRYELLLQPRMFDPSAADGLTLRVR